MAVAGNNDDGDKNRNAERHWLSMSMSFRLSDQICPFCAVIFTYVYSSRPTWSRQYKIATSLQRSQFIAFPKSYFALFPQGNLHPSRSSTPPFRLEVRWGRCVYCPNSGESVFISGRSQFSERRSQQIRQASRLRSFQESCVLQRTTDSWQNGVYVA